MNEVQRRAKAKYKAKVETLRVELYPTDQDIKDRLGQITGLGIPRSTYIKQLIREDLAKRRP